jgi:hypothetical protein
MVCTYLKHSVRRFRFVSEDVMCHTPGVIVPKLKLLEHSVDCHPCLLRKAFLSRPYAASWLYAYGTGGMVKLMNSGKAG